MTRLPDAPATLRIRSIWSDDAGTPHGIRQFFTYGGGAPSDTDLNTMASNVIANAWTYLAAVMSEEKTLVTCEIADLSSAVSANGVSTATFPGTLAGNFLPSSVVVIANFLVPRRYRGGHPRSAMPFGVFGSLLSAQQWTAEFVGLSLAAVGNYIGTIEDAGWAGSGAIEHVDVSYYTDRALRVSPLITAISGYTVNQRVGAQRRRLGRSSG